MKVKILQSFQKVVLYGVLTMLIPPAALFATATRYSFYQVTTVTGTVTDPDNSAALPGVNVLIKGTSIGAVTDADGNYSIQAPSGESILVFSFIGYTTQEIAIGDQTVINVSMIADFQSLQEVIVVGYGTQKKVNVTGAVSTVSSDMIDARPLTSVATALQGTTTGVFVNQNSGQPGRDNVSINIRGIGTLNNSSPLVLVDGIEAPLNNVSPDDIESMTVLKDAASASIYGSRAANGVVLITTKRGTKNGGVSFNYNGYYGVSEAIRLPKMVTNGVQFAELWNEAKSNFGAGPKYEGPQMADIAAIGANTDWFKALFSPAPIQQHNFSVAGSTDKTNFRLSFGTMSQDGVVPKANFKRYNARLNLDTKVNDRFTLGTSISLIQGDRNASREDLTAEGDGSLLANAARSLPIDPIRRDGVLIGPKYGFNNVFMDIAKSDYNVLSREILGSVYAEYEVIKGLKVKGTAAINSRNFFDEQFVRTIEYINPNTDELVSDPITSRSRYRKMWKSENLTTWVQATYDRTFGKHHVNALAGFNQETSEYDEFSASRTNFASNAIPILDYGISNINNTESATAWALQSLFGRINYSFNDRYLFEANIRVDGSSRFQNNKWGTFPSFSAGWIVSQEDFFDGVTFMDMLKVRASWGQLGNQNIGDFKSVRKLSLTENYSFGGNLVQGAGPTSLGNPDLVWETSTTFDVGVNIGLFNSKIEIEADYFQRKTEDILFDIPIPSITGFKTNIYNSATVKNRGWELGITYKNNLGPVGIQVGGNVTHVKSEVIQLNNTLGEDADRKFLGRLILQRGEAINSYYGYRAIGIFRSQEEYDAAPDHTGLHGQYGVGDVRLADINKDGEINDDDRVVIGKTDPTWIVGLNVRVDYKGFDLFALFQGSMDFESYAEGELSQPFFNSAQLQARWLDRWTPENRDASLPRLYETSGPSTAGTSSFWLMDRSYLRLKNLQLGYSVPNTILTRTGIKNLRVYVNAQNLFTITDFPYFDPERPANDPNDSKNEERGGQGFPNLKIISGGLSLNF